MNVEKVTNRRDRKELIEETEKINERINIQARFFAADFLCVPCG